MSLADRSRVAASLALGFVLASGCRDATAPRESAIALSVDAVPSVLVVGDTAVPVVSVLDDAGQPVAGRKPAVTSDAGTVVGVLPDGRLVARSPGTATVRYTTSGVRGPLAYELSLTVMPFARSIVAFVPSPSVFTGDTITVRAIVTDVRTSNAIAGAPVRFASSDTTVAVVDSVSGLVTVRNDGAVAITASHGPVSINVALTSSLVRIALPGAATTVTMSAWHACALVGDGAAYCWGQGGFGELGNGDPNRSDRITPTAVSGGLRFATIDADREGTCALSVDRVPYCWGTFTSWMSNSTANARVPVRVPFGDGTGVAAAVRGHGDAGGCVVDTAGTAWCWGRNAYRQLGTVAGEGNFVFAGRPVPGSVLWSEYKPGWEHGCGLSVARELYCLGYPDYFGSSAGTAYTPFRVVTNLSPVQLAINYRVTCVRDVAGAVECGGTNYYGELGRGFRDSIPFPPARAFAPLATTLRFTSIKAQYRSACGLTAGGELWCWGMLGRDAIASNAGSSGTPHLFSRTRRFVDFAVGAITACGVTADGAVYCGKSVLGANP